MSDSLQMGAHRPVVLTDLGWARMIYWPTLSSDRFAIVSQHKVMVGTFSAGEVLTFDRDDDPARRTPHRDRDE